MESSDAHKTEQDLADALKDAIVFCAESAKKDGLSPTGAASYGQAAAAFTEALERMWKRAVY